MVTEITPAHLAKIIGPAALTKPGSAMRSRQDAILASTAEHINMFGPTFELDKVTNLARFIGQCAVESDYFKTTREYASGAAYEGRKDLGNTQPGDGKRYPGHGLIQTTGRANHSKFNAWAKKTLAGIVKSEIPDFVKNPDKICEFPWAFFSAVYFWSEGNRTGKSLNRYAQENNDEMLTRIINGGLTHYDRRLAMTANAALVLLGYSPDRRGVLEFQTDNKLEVDGAIGGKTRQALHAALRKKDTDAAIEPLRKLDPNIGTLNDPYVQANADQQKNLQDAMRDMQRQKQDYGQLKHLQHNMNEGFPPIPPIAQGVMKPKGILGFILAILNLFKRK